MLLPQTEWLLETVKAHTIHFFSSLLQNDCRPPKLSVSFALPLFLLFSSLPTFQPVSLLEWAPQAVVLLCSVAPPLSKSLAGQRVTDKLSSLAFPSEVCSGRGLF